MLIGAATGLTIFSQLLVIAYADKYDNIFFDKGGNFEQEKTFGGVPGVLPGLNIMIGQGIIDMIRQNLLEYGASYANFDY
jgi:hypothetical protein